MGLRAIVKTGKGTTRHLRHPGGVVPPPAWVELEPDSDGACFLFYYDSSGNVQADTWHESMDAAKAQAAFEFGIGDEDWIEVAYND